MSRKEDWIYELYIKEMMKPKTQPQEFYYEEGKMIMTEQYHLKRGYCCGNGYRHCPYKKTNKHDLK